MQDVQIWLLLPCDAYPQPPGIKCANAEALGVFAQPPLFDMKGNLKE
jgi:hypothetical protein